MSDLIIKREVEKMATDLVNSQSDAAKDQAVRLDKNELFEKNFQNERDSIAKERSGFEAQSVDLKNTRNQLNTLSKI